MARSGDAEGAKDMIAFPKAPGDNKRRRHASGAIETMDVVSPRKRSEMMSRIRSRDTMPEIKVRRIAHAMGLRFRLHRRDLPGSPDVVFPGRRIALFVHGCFWHRHSGCHLAAVPKTRAEFWNTKFQSNIDRDRRTKKELAKLGWRVVVIWECEVNDVETVRRLIRNALDTPNCDAN